MVKHVCAAAGAIVLVSLSISSAEAQGRAAVGQLICTGAGKVGMLIASQQTFDCRFRPAGGRPAQLYRASETTVGIDLGVTGKTTLVWGVFAATPTITPGMLNGTYTGVGADASIAVGGGANVLVGGSNSTISLQPLSAQGQTGLNIAGGVKSLTLRAR